MVPARILAVLMLSAASASASADPTPRSFPGLPLSGFGRAVAISGNTAFVGEPIGGPGIVHIYQHQATGWKEVGALAAPDSSGRGGFGGSLAVAGNTLLVGEFQGGAGGFGRGGGRGRGATPPEPTPMTGVVHVYQRGATGKWVHAGALTASTMSDAQFGASVVIAPGGESAAVGAPGGSSGGRVYVFHRGTDGKWLAAMTVAPDSLAAGDLFGSSLAIDGERVAVGAPGRGGKGAVFVGDHRGDAIVWSEIGGRRIPQNARFGATVLLKGDRLIVGAPAANYVPAESLEPAATTGTGGAARGAGGRGRGGFGGGFGVVVTFERNATSGAWVEGPMAAPYDLSPNAQFGAALAMVGSELWVGAPGSDGMGRIFRVSLDRSGAVAGMSKLMVNAAPGSGGRGGPQFAATFAVGGDAAVVGMPGDAGGLGTVAFLGRTPTGSWVSRGTDFPPVKDRFPAVTGKEVICADGMAASFQCGNTGLLAFMPISMLGGDRTSHMNDNWGWTDPSTGHEYALAGRTDGTAFVDITDPTHPRFLGNLPKTPGVPSGTWRDIKTYKNFAFIVADGSGAHGMQVFDLTRLRTVKTPQTFTEDAHYDRIASAHNIVINEGTGYAYAVGVNGPAASPAGGETCGGGLHMIDIRDPLHPKFAGCFADGKTGRRGTGYSHDAVCVVYKGPDTRYTGHEICVGANETAISLADVTDKAHPVSLSTISYPNVAYAHQGWFTEDQKYFFLDDESDEIAAQTDTTGTDMAAKGTRTMIYDVAKLDDPVLVKQYIGPVKSSDHNLYIKGNKLYEANYGSGLRIIDISDPVNPHEVAFLDTYPDDENQPVMHGAWSNYPYFKSGTIIVTSVTEGLFLVKDRSKIIP
jgi:choice-of-anchor B domain-containing protein